MKPHGLILIPFIGIMLNTHQLAAQQQIDPGAASEAYTGGFFRINAGIAPGNFNFDDEYGDRFSSLGILGVHFNILGGKRFGRVFAPYFHVFGNVMVKPTASLVQHNVSGMGLGTYLYVVGPNTYIAPEAGLAVLMLETSDGMDYTDNAGACFTLRTGRDLYLGGKVFVGIQAMFSYYFANDMDNESLVGGNGTYYGINLSLRLWK